MKNFYYSIKKVSDVIGGIIQNITAVIILFLLLLSVGQVFLRSFNLPQMGVEEIMKFPTIWMYMLGGICASYTRTHIDCGILESFIKSERPKKIMAVIKCVLSIIVSIFAITWTMEYLKYCFETDKVSVIYGIPWKYANVAILVGIVGMLFYVVLELIEDVLALAMEADGKEEKS